MRLSPCNLHIHTPLRTRPNRRVGRRIRPPINHIFPRTVSDYILGRRTSSCISCGRSATCTSHDTFSRAHHTWTSSLHVDISKRTSLCKGHTGDHTRPRRGGHRAGVSHTPACRGRERVLADTGDTVQRNGVHTPSQLRMAPSKAASTYHLIQTQ